MASNRIKVLCFFRFWSYASGVRVESTDSVMIHPTASREIRDYFEAIMKWRRDNWRPTWVGPIPVRYELIGYMTETGDQVF